VEQLVKEFHCQVDDNDDNKGSTLMNKYKDLVIARNVVIMSLHVYCYASHAAV